jgi:N-acetylmuramoyl-L-alanine amidase
MFNFRQILAIFLFVAVFALSQASAKAELRILDLGFDNSDNIIWLRSVGELGEAKITKGALVEPSRVFFDIPNAVLTTPSKSWTFKNSSINAVRISQFSLNPNVVRITINYNRGSPNNFQAFTNNEQIIIKYGASAKMVEGPEFSSFYTNTAATVFYENAQTTLDEPDETLPPSPERQYQLNSKYYINSVSVGQRGLLVGGLGAVTLRPVIYLTNPDRMVVDIENAVLAPNLRNRSFQFTPMGATILRLGQFERNIVRLVVEGPDARGHRAVISPDLQNIFIAKREDVLNSKLTNSPTSVLSYTAEKSGEWDVLNIQFTNPLTLSAFEEGGNFFLDMQNVSDVNRRALENLVQAPQFSDVKWLKIASDKTRLVFATPDATQINAQITQDAKNVRLAFRMPQAPAAQPPRESFIRNLLNPGARISNLFKVVIDPGHGGSDPGAMYGDVREKDIVLDISNLVMRKLNEQKVVVEMTRERDRTVSLAERAEFANASEANVFVSIHVNASVKEDIVGLETHWWREESRELAQSIQNAMTAPKIFKKWEMQDRGLFKSQFYVINHTTMPAVLVEVGFMSNPQERVKILDKKYQEDIADAIVEGIMNYLRQGQGRR